jgi:hypothetical protein
MHPEMTLLDVSRIVCAASFGATLACLLMTVFPSLLARLKRLFRRLRTTRPHPPMVAASRSGIHREPHRASRRRSRWSMLTPGSAG